MTCPDPVLEMLWFFAACESPTVLIFTLLVFLIVSVQLK